jgi:tRNA uridine 5-carboxymethylaminomethyl modification enzyme
MDGMKIPEGFEASLVRGLGREAIEKVGQHKPKTIGEMKRIPGLTPSDLMNVFIHLSMKNVPRGTSREGDPSDDE